MKQLLLNPLIDATMKKNRFNIGAILCACLFGNALNAQVECVSLNGYTDIYMDFVSTDDNTFPPGHCLFRAEVLVT